MCDTPGLVTLNPQAARLLATEVLLADPEALGDDVLESCLYILRDKLQGAVIPADDRDQQDSGGPVVSPT
jgi:hypothetical protein